MPQRRIGGLLLLRFSGWARLAVCNVLRGPDALHPLTSPLAGQVLRAKRCAYVLSDPWAALSLMGHLAMSGHISAVTAGEGAALGTWRVKARGREAAPNTLRSEALPRVSAVPRLTDAAPGETCVGTNVVLGDSPGS